MRTMILATILMIAFAARAEDPTPLPLWENGAPGALGSEPKDIPSITPYIPESGATGAAMVILPGGGYQHLSTTEGKDYALFLNMHGMTCFVVKYRLGPDYHHPSMMQDGLRAVRWVRASAEKYKIDPKRLGIIGSSAGGHLASTVMTHFDAGDPNAADRIDRESSRPDFGVLVYPVISMTEISHAGSKKNLLGEDPSVELIKLLSNDEQVTPETPPCFIWSGQDDKTVKVENSLRFATACAKNKVPFELHIYEHARHGLALGDKPPFANAHPWSGEMVRWLKTWNSAPKPN
jgi:acetyl esterase/lipase